MEAALQVPMVVAARLLLELAVGGLILIPAGALKRVDVWHVFDQTESPGYDKATTLAVNKVINEDGPQGVLFTRIALQVAGAPVEAFRGPKGDQDRKGAARPASCPALLAQLFETVFWKVNLQDFDRNPIEFWPQHHMGVILWSLSVTAHSWSNAGDLISAFTIMDTLDKVPRPDLPEFAMVTRALRPLTW